MLSRVYHSAGSLPCLEIPERPRPRLLLLLYLLLPREDVLADYLARSLAYLIFSSVSLSNTPASSGMVGLGPVDELPSKAMSTNSPVS